MFSNNKNVKVLEWVKVFKIEIFLFIKEEINIESGILKLLKKDKLDFIVFVGFLWKFLENILNEYFNKVINIYLVLLLKYGGKGMYGKYVYEVVVKNVEKEIGIIIYYVNENYDEGVVIF